MILSYEKLPCEKQRPVSSTLWRVFCISLSFFWPTLAIAGTSGPTPIKSHLKFADSPAPEDASTNPQTHSGASLSADASAVVTNTGSSGDLTDKTDREINKLVRSWPQLNPAQRRDLLAEVRVRMNKARVQVGAANKGQQRIGQSDIEVGLSRAQRQFKYGQSMPRNQKGTVIITAKVTRILPDGTRVTQSTVTPVPLEEFRKRAASGSAATILLPGNRPPTATSDENPDPSLAVGSPQPQSGNQAAEQPRRQVFRATVRFGAGFGRRDKASDQGQFTSASRQQNVQQVSAPFAQDNEQHANPTADQANEEPARKILKQGAQ